MAKSILFVTGTRADFGKLEPLAIAARDADLAYAKAEEAKAGIARAEANLEEVKKRLGQEGDQNSKFKQALARLEQARLNLAYSNIMAKPA